jgi:chitinase
MESFVKHLLASCFVVASTLSSGVASAGASPTILRSGFEAGEGGSEKWVAGYYVGYEEDLQPVSALDFDGLTHLMVGAVLPNANGTLATHYYIDDVQGPIWAQAAIDAAQAAGRKAVLMIGGAGTIDGFRGAASAANRTAFVQNLLALVDATGADGLDLDWEPIEAQDRAPLTALAQALRAARPQMILTIPINVVNSNFSNPDDEAAFYAGIAPLFDQFNMMSYGMGYDYDGWHSWFSAPLDGEAGNTPTSISHSAAYYVAAGVPAAKLGVGTGFYGTCYRRVTQPRVPVQFGDIVASDGAMSYRNIVGQYAPLMSAGYDMVAQAPYLSSATGRGPQACTYVTFENAQSIAAKGAWVHAQGLGGTIIWTISQGHLPSLPAGQRDPLLDAMDAAFLQP